MSSESPVEHNSLSPAPALAPGRSAAYPPAMAALRSDIVPVGICYTDAAANVLWMNAACARLLGLSLAEASGSDWSRNLHPEDRPRVEEGVARALRETVSFDSEHRFVHADGSVVWVFAQFHPEHDAAGRLTGWIGTVTDVTRSKLAEQRLRESEQLYQALVEHNPAGIWQLGLPDGRTVYMNDKMRQLLEIEDEPRVAGAGGWPKTFYDCLTPESQRRALAEHAKRAQGHASTYEVEMVGRRGTHRNVIVSGAPVLDANGVLTGMIGSFSDVTQQRKAARDLVESGTQLRLLAEQTPAVLWTTDRELRFTSSNGSGLARLGLKPNQTNGVSFYDFFGRNGQPASADMTTIVAHKLALSGVANHYEEVWAGGTYGCRVEPLRGLDGTIIGVTGVALDITNQKRVENELREARTWLEVRVRQRTEELERANITLRREIEERKKAEEDLRQSQARYASILNSQQTLVARSDMQGRITYVNAAHQRMFGSHVGDSVMARVHPDDLAATEHAMAELHRPPYACTLEQRCEVRGQWRTFSWQVGVMRDRSGQIVEYQGVGFDITDRKNAEEMLRRSERRARENEQEAREVAEFNRRLVQEVDHRVRNNLAGLLSLVSAMRDSMRDQPRGGAGARQASVQGSLPVNGHPRDVDAFAEAIEHRLLAMTHVHRLLAETDWKPVDLHNLIRSLLSEVEKLGCQPTPVTILGPPVPISPRQAPALSMILLEWFTNSCKYGAHSAPGGALRIAWTAAGDADHPRTQLRWTESGAPPIHGPIVPSLGTQLVHGFAKQELRGKCELHFPPTGADHLLEFPRE